MTQPNDLSNLVASFDAFEDVSEVVSDTLRFKLKLGIGEDAYATLRYGKNLTKLWDIGGVAASGAGAAASQAVAVAFFSPAGWLAKLGIGATASTPVGWVIAAAVVSAGAYYGVTRVAREYSASRTQTIPRFINTPMDLLGTSLFDLLAPLAIKIAKIDGHYHDLERDVIFTHFVREWGYSPEFVSAGLSLVEETVDDLALVEIVKALAELKRTNPDCNYQHMTKDLLSFLRDIALADHREDEREVLGIEKVEQILQEEGRFSVTRRASEIWSRMGTRRNSSH